TSSANRAPAPAGDLRRIPIGVFDPVYDDFSLDAMLDKVSALGLEAMEIGTGGYPNNRHCPLDDLIKDRAAAKAWQKKFEDRGIRVATLSCHGNPIHPDASLAKKDIDTFRKTVLLAEILDVKVIVGFSGCPGGTPQDTSRIGSPIAGPPNTPTCRTGSGKKKSSLIGRKQPNTRAITASNVLLSKCIRTLLFIIPEH